MFHRLIGCRAVLSAQAGNYVHDGILAGIKSFIEKNLDLGLKEIKVGYGKDYCAAVGACVKEYEGTFLGEAGVGELPPYWDELNRWYVRHSVDRPEAAELRELATVGIYEGETVVFPVIAAGDLRTLRWLLSPPIERLGQGLTDGSGTPWR